ncbi:hypothetical protein WA158_001533 [Blastocystis sp. Blastoise]
MLFIPSLGFSILNQTILWSSTDQSKYGCYRIPSLLHLEKGIVVAAIEARQGNCGDSSQSDTLIRISQDNGINWSNNIIIPCFSHVKGYQSTGETGLIFDKQTHTLFAISEFFHSDTVTNDGNPVIDIRVAASYDYGYTWKLKRIVDDPGQHSPSGTLASGVQLPSGRLAICFRRGVAFSKTFYSDNHGNTWQFSQNSTGINSSECQIASLPDGRLYMTAREYKSLNTNPRLQSWSFDNGTSWQPYTHIPAGIIPDPNCEGSVVADTNGILYLSLPHSTSKRIDITIYISKDKCMTWNSSYLIYKGPSGYSSISVLLNNTIGLLHEGGPHFAEEHIYFHRIII